MKRILVLLCLLSVSQGALAVTPWMAADITEAVSKGSWESSETLFRDLMANADAQEQALEIRYNLGLSLFHQKKFEEALPYFEEVSEAKGERKLRAQATYNKGNTLHALERIEEAKEAFKQTLLLDSDDDDARYNLEMLQEQDKQDEQDQNDENQDQENEEQEDKDKEQEQDQKDQGEGDQDKDKEDKPEDKDGKPEDKDGKQGENGDKPEDADQKPADQKDAKAGQEEGSQANAGQQKPQQMSEAERKAQEEALERARLLEFFKQQERDGRPPIRVAPQNPPVEGKTW